MKDEQRRVEQKGACGVAAWSVFCIDLLVVRSVVSQSKGCGKLWRDQVYFHFACGPFFLFPKNSSFLFVLPVRLYIACSCR